MESDSFEAQLRKRIESYLAAERQAERRFLEAKDELERTRQRRLAAETVYNAEFGTGAPSEPPHDSASPRRATHADSDRAIQAPLIESVDGDPPKLPIDQSVGPYTDLSWADAIERALRKADRPLHVREIWRTLEEGGFRTEASDPHRSIVAVAVRHPRMFRAAPNTYALTGTGVGKEG